MPFAKKISCCWRVASDELTVVRDSVTAAGGITRTRDKFSLSTSILYFSERVTSQENGYPQGIINYHINDVLNKNRHQHSNPLSTVSKNGIVILLHYLGLRSNQVAKRLKSCVCKFYSCVNLKIVLQSTRCIKSFFPYKDRINRSQQSRVIYGSSQFRSHQETKMAAPSDSTIVTYDLTEK